MEENDVSLFVLSQQHSDNKLETINIICFNTVVVVDDEDEDDDNCVDNCCNAMRYGSVMTV